MEDMGGELEMDLESMIAGEGEFPSGDKTSHRAGEVLTNIQQSSRALQQMGLILSKKYLSEDK